MNKLMGSVIADIVISVILMVLTISAFCFEWMPTTYLEYKVYDSVSNLKERTSNPPIVIIAVDDESIANMGRWP